MEGASNMRGIARLAVFLLLEPAVLGGQPQGRATRDEAMDLLRRGEAKAAILLLQGFLKERPSGRSADEASILLASTLMAQKRPSEAIAPLERVVAAGVVAPGYANILLATAIVDENAAEKLDLGEKQAALWATQADASPLIRERAMQLLVRIASLQRRWGAVVASGESFLLSWPKSRSVDDVRWLTAEAYRQMGRTADASRTFGDIWYDSPASPWAKEAHGHLLGLKMAARALNPDQRFAFVKALQKAGLHSEALDEIDTYRRQASAPKLDHILYARAVSLHALRKNTECVRSVE